MVKAFFSQKEVGIMTGGAQGVIDFILLDQLSCALWWGCPLSIMACLYFCDFTSHGAQVYILSWCVLCRYFCTYFLNCVNNCHMVICSLELLEISPAYFKLSTYSFWMRLFLSRLKICFQFSCQVYSSKKIEHRCEQMYAVGSPYHKLS